MSSNAENILIVREDESNSIFRILKRFLKKFVTLSTIYLVGYFDLSIAWLIAPVILSAFREEWKISKERKRESVKMVMQNEKKVILSVVGEDLPSWVFFPDIERAEWVNKMLIQMWPSLTIYAHDVIKTTVQPKIQETLEMYNMKGFEFVKLRLGTIPPRIGGIKVYDRLHNRTEIMVDVDLIYVGDCDISFTFKGMSGGIKDFQIHGMMRLIMKPLIPVIPFVGGIQVFFLNKPNVDFNLVGVADVLDIPGISDVLRKVIVEQISAMMVLPNKLPIVLSDAVPSQGIKTPEPEGVLRVHVVQAIKLMKKDVSMLGRGKSDPYIIVTMGAQEFRSKTIDNTVNPKWDFWCEGLISDPKSQTLKIEVWDEDASLPGTVNDDFLGRGCLKLDDVFEKGEVDKWITLEEVKHGMVHLRLSYYHLSSDVSDLKPSQDELDLLRVPSINSAVLIFYLDSVHNLPDAKANKRPDPIVTISAGHETKSTGVQFRTNSPVYEQGFVFLIHNPKIDAFNVKITDQKTNTELGSFGYHISTLLGLDDWKRDLEPFLLSKSGNNCKIVFSAQLKVLKKAVVSTNSTIVDPPTSAVTPPATPSPTPTEVIQPDVITDAAKSNDETSKDVKSISNEDSISGDIKSLSSVDGNEEDLNWEAFQSEEVKNSCQWIADQYELPRQNSSVSGSIKGSLRRRKPSQTESVKPLGSVELTLNYIPPRQKLVITIHRIVDLPAKDPSDLPDPYVKVYLLPNKTKDHKRKTKVIKDTCNPVYEEYFDYVISEEEIAHRKLNISVVSQKTTFYSTNSIMGQVTINLKDTNLNNNKMWCELEPNVD